MTAAPARLAMLTLDCADAPASASWSAMLGWDVVHSEAGAAGPLGHPFCRTEAENWG